MGVALEMQGFTPSHFPTLPKTWGVTLGLPLGSQPCNPFALVVSPRLGLRHLVFHLNCHVMLKVEQYAIDYVKVC